MVAGPDDLAAVLELEGWTNDRVSTELGILHRLPREEWVTGRPMASVVMAPFCHPSHQGGRFSGPDRGAWYAALALTTAQAEVTHHRSAELHEINVHDALMQMRLYYADFSAPFHDLRPELPELARFQDLESYGASQRLAVKLLRRGSNGVIYRSVRDPNGQCIACFRPALVTNVRIGAHYELRWVGGEPTTWRRIRAPRPHR